MSDTLPTRPRYAQAFALALVAALGGCVTDCPELRVCDILQRDCQRSVMEVMTCMRGNDLGALPRVSVVTEADLSMRFAGDGEDDAERLEQEAAYARWTRGLSLYGLAPVDYAAQNSRDDAASEIAAAYFPSEREIVIVDRGEPLADADAVELFAHEIVHALQDQSFDLIAYGDRWATTFDSSLAVDAVIEGEAVHYQLRAGATLHGVLWDDVDWAGFYADWQAEELDAAARDDAPVSLAGIRFPYAFGAALVHEREDRFGRAGIDALLDAPPRTASEILFDTPPEALDDALDAIYERSVPALDDAYEPVAATPLGAWIARIVGVHAGLGATEASRLAETLGADVFSVQHDASADAVLAAWRTRAIGGASADAWTSLLPPPVAAVLDGDTREAVLVAVDSDPAPDVAALAWRAPDEDAASSDGMSAAARAHWRATTGVPHRACVLSRRSAALPLKP